MPDKGGKTPSFRTGGKEQYYENFTSASFLPASEPQPDCMAMFPPPEEQFFQCQLMSCVYGDKANTKLKFTLMSKNGFATNSKLPVLLGSK